MVFCGVVRLKAGRGLGRFERCEIWTRNLSRNCLCGRNLSFPWKRESRFLSEEQYACHSGPRGIFLEEGFPLPAYNRGDGLRGTNREMNA